LDFVEIDKSFIYGHDIIIQQSKFDGD